jgi:hypothetical protein
MTMDIDIISLAQRIKLDPKPNGGDWAYVRCYNYKSHKNGDRNPSLGLNRKANRYKCFVPGCGVHGDAVKLFMKCTGQICRQDAMQEIRSNFNGCEIHDNKPVDNSKNIISQAFQEALDFIGGCPESYANLAKDRKFENVKKAIHLMKTNRIGFLHGNYIFPLFDIGGNVIGLQRFEQNGVLTLNGKRMKSGGKPIRCANYSVQNGYRPGLFGLAPVFDNNYKIHTYIRCESPIKALSLQLHMDFDGANGILAYGVPGAGTSPDCENELIKGSLLYFCHDWDFGEVNPGQVAVQQVSKKLSSAAVLFNITPPQEIIDKFESNYYSKVDIADDLFNEAVFQPEEFTALMDAAEEISIQEVPDKEFYRKADLGKWLNEEPPAPQWVFNDVLLQNILGAILAQGGTGKTLFSFGLAISAATGNMIFDLFKPSEQMKVLCVFGEDSEPIIWQRLKAIISDLERQKIFVDENLLTNNLYLFCGQSDPLMKLDFGNPVITDAYKRLQNKIEDVKPKLVILDPKSQFYGLEENSNDYNTQWTNSLKRLTNINGATVLFTHHVTKASNGLLNQSAARGGGALTDNCRWVANMTKISEKTAKKFGLDKHEDFVEFKITKSSYTRLPSDSIYFSKVEGGVLRQAELASHKFSTIIDIIEGLLQDGSMNDVSIDQLLTKPKGKELRDKISEIAGWNVTKINIENAINGGINQEVFWVDDKIKYGSCKPTRYLKIKEVVV